MTTPRFPNRAGYLGAIAFIADAIMRLPPWNQKGRQRREAIIKELEQEMKEHYPIPTYAVEYQYPDGTWRRSSCWSGLPLETAQKRVKQIETSKPYRIVQDGVM